MRTHTRECRSAYRHVCVRAQECANTGVHTRLCTWEWACLQAGACPHTYPFALPTRVCVDAQVCVCLHACAPRRVPRQACARACACADAGRARIPLRGWLRGHTGARRCVRDTRVRAHACKQPWGCPPPSPSPLQPPPPPPVRYQQLKISPTAASSHRHGNGRMGSGAWGDGGLRPPPPAASPQSAGTGTLRGSRSGVNPPGVQGCPEVPPWGGGSREGGGGGAAPHLCRLCSERGGGAPRPLNPPVNHSWGRGAANPPAPGPGLGGRAAAQPARGPGSRGGDTHGPYS